MKTYNITRTITNGDLINKITLYKHLSKKAAVSKFNELKERARKYADFGGYEGALQFGFAKYTSGGVYEDVDFYLTPSNVFI